MFRTKNDLSEEVRAKAVELVLSTPGDLAGRHCASRWAEPKRKSSSDSVQSFPTLVEDFGILTKRSQAYRVRVPAY